MNIVAIILAAGEGRRMGLPKAILKIGDSYLSDIQYDNLLACGVRNIKIIIGAGGVDVMNKLLHRQDCVINTHYTLGQFSSLICGIRAFHEFDCIVVMPVDNYPVDRGVIKRIIDCVDINFDATAPVYKGRRGHPVILTKGFANSLLRRDIKTSRLDLLLRDVRVRLVEVDSNCIHNNLNYPLY